MRFFGGGEGGSEHRLNDWKPWCANAVPGQGGDCKKALVCECCASHSHSGDAVPGPGQAGTKKGSYGHCPCSKACAYSDTEEPLLPELPVLSSASLFDEGSCTKFEWL